MRKPTKEDYDNWKALSEAGKLNDDYAQDLSFFTHNHQWGPTLTKEEWESAPMQDEMTPGMREQYDEGVINAEKVMRNGYPKQEKNQPILLSAPYSHKPQIEEIIDGELYESKYLPSGELVYVLQDNNKYKRLRG